MFTFSHTFPVPWGFTDPILWLLHGFLLHAKYLINSSLSNVYFYYFLPPIHEWEKYGYSHLFSINWEKGFPSLFKNLQPGINIQYGFPLNISMLEVFIHFQALEIV